jgi:hypothetical protein
MSDIYCGIEKVPKGKRLGSMIECAEKGQVRYYGLNKIDTRVLEHVRNEKKNDKTQSKLRDKLIVKLVELKEKKKILTDKIEYSKDKTKKLAIEKELKIVTKDLKENVAKLKQSEKTKEDEEENDEEEEIVEIKAKPKAKAKPEPKLESEMSYEERVNKKRNDMIAKMKEPKKVISPEDQQMIDSWNDKLKVIYRRLAIAEVNNDKERIKKAQADGKEATAKIQEIKNKYYQK